MQLDFTLIWRKIRQIEYCNLICIWFDLTEKFVEVNTTQSTVEKCYFHEIFVNKE